MADWSRWAAVDLCRMRQFALTSVHLKREMDFLATRHSALATAFLIDTPAIRNAAKSLKINARTRF